MRVSRDFKNALFLFMVCCPAFSSDALDADARTEVVNNIATSLIERYVFEDIGTQAGDYLKKKLADGSYDAFSDADAYAAKLTEDLQSVTHDKHMRVRHRPSRKVEGSPENPILTAVRMEENSRARNKGFNRVEVLEGNVGYLDLRAFSPVNEMKTLATGAMGLLENVDAFILDLRKNGGGDPNAVQFLCSYFFEGGVHLNSLYYRFTSTTEDFYTLDEVPGKRLIDVPMIVLTSERTFSAGEECAYNLLTQKRATLIGQVTGGGANPGANVSVGSNIGVFIPTGRAINPITKTNWEGVGVIPNIETSVEEAYDIGLAKAREVAEQYRAGKKQMAEVYIAEFDEAMARAKAKLAANDEPAATAILSARLKAGFAKQLLNETMVNLMGYQMARQGELFTAKVCMQANINAFPNHGNVYDSMGDVLELSGEIAEAIKSYTKAVEVGKAQDDPYLEAYEANLARLKAASK